MMRWVVLTCLLATSPLLSGCHRHDGKAAAVSTPPSKQYIVLVDMSVSRDEKSHLDSLQFLQKLAKNLSYGDEFLVLPVQQNGVRDEGEVTRAMMPSPGIEGRPSPDDEGDLEAERRNASEAVPHFFKEQAKQKLLHTDLLATLAIAGDRIRERKATASEIIILSDMLQSAQSIEMDRAQRMPPKDWVARRKEQRQLPDLKGACIAVIGEDKTSKYDPAIRSFWTEYFGASGAELSARNIWISPPSDMAALCR